MLLYPIVEKCVPTAGSDVASRFRKEGRGFAYAPGAVVYGENGTTPLVSSIAQGEGENAMNFAYEYDNRGNINSETRNGLTTVTPRK